MIGTSISRYDILEELGQGGMSVVYLARDTGLNRQVAVKLLHSHLANKPENRKRFRREAEAIARLRHPNILDVYDVSDAAGERSFIVMEYVEGMNLRQFIEHHGPPPAEVACLIGAQICNALAHAHQHGVIHRDLKPENIMISTAGAVKLMDFGIAHVIGAETMTRTGSLIGSPAHMAPEMIDGEQVDERADIFALGTVLYWMSTGRLPFSGENTPQVLRNVMECRFEPPELVEPKISHDLARIIGRSLRLEPAERFASVEALKRELFAAVHAVGLEDADAILNAYFADPDAYLPEFERDIVPRLIGCARRATARRPQLPISTAYWPSTRRTPRCASACEACTGGGESGWAGRSRSHWSSRGAAVGCCILSGWRAGVSTSRSPNRNRA
jgi:serine/threonine-protein kinase